MEQAAEETVVSPRPAKVRPLSTGSRPPTPRLDVLLLDAASRQALVTLRSLGRRRLSVGAMEAFPHAPAFSSRWCGERFVSRGGYGTDAYLHAMEDALDRTNAPVVIPAHDGTISLLRRHRGHLERRARLALASEEAMAIAVNKAQTLEVAGQLGIAVPGTAVATGPDDLPDALEGIGLPAVIKPCESWVSANGRGARVVPHLVTTAAEAGQVLRELTRFGGAALVQRFVGGRREAVSLLYADGRVYARFAQWAQRTFPPLGGDSVLRESIPVPEDIGDQAERLVRAINLEGYSEVEFRRDDAGVPCLMEVNPRLSASVEIAVRSGVDFPFLVKQWASGEPVDRVERYRSGLWMRYLGGDVRGTIETIRQRGRPGITTPGRAARDFVVAFFRPMAYDYFQWRDPAPAVSATAAFLRRTVSGVLRRDGSSLGRSSHGRSGEGDAPTARVPRTT